jgi:hypothetical protein
MPLKLHPPLGSEIDLFDALGLGLCPGIHSHPLDQAEVKDLCVVRQAVCLVGVRVEGIAGKVRTVTAKGHAFILGAGVNGAILWNDGALSLHLAASGASDIFFRDAKLLRDSCSQFVVLVCQMNDTIKARQTARRCHVGQVHSLFCHGFY